MTTVTIPALVVVGLAGDTGSVVLSYDLVSAGLRPMVGLRSVDGALVTCHGSKTISDTDMDNPLVSWDLTPQASIVTPDGQPSYYRIACHRESNIVPVTVWVVQVPDLYDPIDLRDLVGSSTIQPPSVGIPAGGSESQILAKKSVNDYDTEWIPAPSGSTNLSVTNKTSTSLDIASDTGADATLPAATADDAGLMTAAQHTKLSGIEASATAAGATGDGFAVSHLTAFDHANIANGQAAYGWGNHAGAGYLTALPVHNHAASDITSGTVATVRLGSGTADSTTYLRGDQSWATVPAGVTVEDTPVDGHTAAAVSSNWAYDHAALPAHALTTTQIANLDTAYGWGNHASAGYLTSVTYGTTAGTACQGNDARLSDARTPTAHTHTGTYEPAQTAASQAEAEAGSETAIRSWSPLRVWQGIAAKVAAMLAAGIAPYLTGYTEKLHVATTSGNVTIDLANGTFHRYTLDAARQFTMPSGPGAYASSFSLLILCQTYTPTWNTTPTITWMTDDGTAPALNTATGKLNRLFFEWDNTTSAWLGYLVRAQA